jgi:hypothetical protein
VRHRRSDAFVSRTIDVSRDIFVLGVKPHTKSRTRRKQRTTSDEFNRILELADRPTEGVVVQCMCHGPICRPGDIGGRRVDAAAGDRRLTDDEPTETTNHGRLYIRLSAPWSAIVRCSDPRVTVNCTHPTRLRRWRWRLKLMADNRSSSLLPTLSVGSAKVRAARWFPRRRRLSQRSLIVRGWSACRARQQVCSWGPATRCCCGGGGGGVYLPVFVAAEAVNSVCSTPRRRADVDYLTAPNQIARRGLVRHLRARHRRRQRRRGARPFSFRSPSCDALPGDRSALMYGFHETFAREMRRRKTRVWRARWRGGRTTSVGFLWDSLITYIRLQRSPRLSSRGAAGAATADGERWSKSVPRPAHAPNGENGRLKERRK